MDEGGKDEVRLWKTALVAGVRVSWLIKRSEWESRYKLHLSWPDMRDHSV